MSGTLSIHDFLHDAHVPYVVMPHRPDQSQVVRRAKSLPGSLLQAAPTHLSVARVMPPRVSSQGR